MRQRSRARRAIVCPSCGTKTRADRSECPHCEKSLADAVQAQALEANVRWPTDWDGWVSRLRDRGPDAGLVVLGVLMLMAIGRTVGGPPPPRLIAPAPPRVAAEAAPLERPVDVTEAAEGPDPVTAGLQWLEAGAVDQALAHFRSAADVHPANVEVRHTLGRLLLDVGHPEEALGHLEIAALARGADWRRHADFGEALEAIGAWDRAAAEYDDALRLRPDDVETHRRLGRALYESGSPLEAVKVLLDALKLAPDVAPLYPTLGASYEALNRRADAAVAYRRYLELAPDGDWSPEARARLDALDDPERPIDLAERGAAGGTRPDRSPPRS